jgi:hypothetical protein
MHQLEFEIKKPRNNHKQTKSFLGRPTKPTTGKKKKLWNKRKMAVSLVHCKEKIIAHTETDAVHNEIVALPLGTTVIGRGALLGIHDQHLSRKQAEITVEKKGSSGYTIKFKTVHRRCCLLF